MRGGGHLVNGFRIFKVRDLSPKVVISVRSSVSWSEYLRM